MSDPTTPPQDNQTQQGDQAAATDNADLAQIKSELEQTQAKLTEMMTISQRALADLQNFKRRSEEEKASFITYSNAELILALVPALNSANLALKHEPKDAEWAKGVEQALKQMASALEARGLRIINTAGQKFDPKIHEALMMAPGEKDLILEELEQGYILGDKVIKPARVKVGNGEQVPA